jgi:hypothetical protein
MLDRRRTTFEFEAVLRGIQPRIWRRFRLPAAALLADLHDALQIMYGWEDQHLFEFRDARGRVYAEPSEDDDRRVIDPGRKFLSTLFKAPGDALVYHYDFGDDWQADVVLTQIVAGRERVDCLAGERAGPPEDCGGPCGYEELVKALADVDHPRHSELREWAEDFDPEHISLAEIRQALKLEFNWRL